MSAVNGNYVCSLYYFPVTNDNESNTQDEPLSSADWINLSHGTSSSSVDVDALLQNVEISPFQHDDSLHSTTRKSSHPKRTLGCYPSLDFETKRSRYVSSIDESVIELMQTFEDETLSVNNAKRQKLQVTATSTEPKYDAKRITRVSPPILEIARSKEDDHVHDVSNHDQHYSQTISPCLSFDQNQKKPQQHEHLSTTLNFPYKDFIKKNQGDNIQLWHDEEEQSRLEKHFNTKWQVEFFSKFYSGELLETPDIFGPKTKGSENQAKKDDSSKNCSLSASTTRSEEDDDVVFVSITPNTFKNSSEDNRHVQEKERKDHSNTQNETCISSSASSVISHHSSILLEEAAIKLCAAMDDTDKTRDIITRLEKEMQVNRDVILKDERIVYYGATSYQ